MANVKKYIFSFIALVLIPLFFLLIIELSLMGFGVGTSYDYFNELEINGELHYQENRDFADQFYPASLGIGPLNNTFTDERAPDLVRVYILGGSAAQGFPHINHGLNRHLEAQLKAALPNKQIEVLNLAMTSVNSHVVYEVAKSIPDNSADFAVILMGNNEVVGPYGPSTFSQNFLSNLTLIRALQALKRTRTWQALESLIQQVKPAEEKQELVWQGMQMFTENAVSHDDPRLQSVYSHYENNLRDIIDLLHDKDIHVVLSSVPVNLRHSAPFGSAHKASLTDAQLSDWNALNDQASKSYEQKNWDAAIATYSQALTIDADYADTHFRMATAYENLNQHDKAKLHFERALDLDTLRFRSDTNINKIIKDVAASYQGEALNFVDSQGRFEQVSKPLQPGWDLLHEHVHYDFMGNYVLAAELTSSIMSSASNLTGFQPLGSKEVAERIGYPNHETNTIMTRLLNLVKSPPFTNQSNAKELENFVIAQKDAIAQAVGKPADVIKRRQPIVDSGLADWRIHFELAELNRFTSNRDAQKFHLGEIFKQYPHNHESYMKIAQMMTRDGKIRETIDYLEQSLYYTRGDEAKIAHAQGLLGLSYFKIDEYDKATEILLEMINDYSDQIGTTLRAYGILVKYARESRNNRDMNRHIIAVERYAEQLIREGKDASFPLFGKRMAQIMLIAGKQAESRKWQNYKPAEKK